MTAEKKRRPVHDDGTVHDLRAVVKGLEEPDARRVLRWFFGGIPEWVYQGTAEHGNGWMSKHRIAPWTQDALNYVLDNDPVFDKSMAKLDNVALNCFIEMYAIARKDPVLKRMQDAAYARAKAHAVAERQRELRKWMEDMTTSLADAEREDQESLADLLKYILLAIEAETEPHYARRMKALFDRYSPRLIQGKDDSSG